MKAKHYPFVTIIVATYNRKELLQRCLASLLEQTYPKDSYEVIVVDDGSTDGTDALLQEMAAKPGPPLRHFRQENKGSATARNLGISQALGQIIASTDDDCIASLTWIEDGIDCFTSDEIVGVQGRILPAEPVRMQIFPPRFAYTVEVTKAMWGFGTGNMFYRKEAIAAAGGFNERYRMAEDADLGWRILEGGMDIVFSPQPLVYHAVFYDTLVKRLRSMTRFQYEPLLFKEHPQFKKRLLLGFVYSKEVLHVPFFILAVLVALVSALLRASLLPAGILTLIWFAVYLWSNVFVDRNVQLFPVRTALFPVKLLLHSTKVFYRLVGSIRYRTLII